MQGAFMIFLAVAVVVYVMTSIRRYGALDDIELTLSRLPLHVLVWLRMNVLAAAFLFNGGCIMLSVAR